MKKITSTFAAAFLLLSILTQAAIAAPLNVVHSGKWPPYSDQGLPGQGLGVELVTEAFKRAGYETYLSTDSWERILEGGKIGVYDVVATAWYSDQRNDYLDFSEPYLETYVRFITKKGSKFKFNGLEDLRGQMIGVLIDYAYDPGFDQSRDLIKIPERNMVQNLLKLKQGRIDATLGDERVLKYQINQYMPNTMPQFEILPKPLTVSGIHVGVSRENPDHAKIVADFNKAIETMKKDGSYQKILDKHNAYIEKPAS